MIVANDTVIASSSSRLLPEVFVVTKWAIVLQRVRGHICPKEYGSGEVVDAEVARSVAPNVGVESFAIIASCAAIFSPMR